MPNKPQTLNTSVYIHTQKTAKDSGCTMLWTSVDTHTRQWLHHALDQWWLQRPTCDWALSAEPDSSKVYSCRRSLSNPRPSHLLSSNRKPLHSAHKASATGDLWFIRRLRPVNHYMSCYQRTNACHVISQPMHVMFSVNQCMSCSQSTSACHVINQPMHVINQPMHVINQPMHAINQPMHVTNQPMHVMLSIN